MVLFYLYDISKNHYVGLPVYNGERKNSIFINTARAELVDEEALIDALQSHKIRGACLDVYYNEPLPKDYPLLKMDNVTLMPHSAGVTADMEKNSLKIIIKDIERFLKGEKLQFEIKEDN